MLKIITTLTMFAIGLLAQAQVSETIKLLPFSKIEASNGVEIIVVESDNYLMKAEADNTTDLKSIVMNCTNNTLFISKTSGARVKIYVDAPRLASIVASSGARIRIVDKITADDIAISLSTGAFFHGTVVAENVNLKTKSGSVCNLHVKAGSLNGHFSGKSKVNLSGSASDASIHSGQDAFCTARNLVSERISVNAENLSKVLVYGCGEIDVAASDKAKVTYFGTPERVNYSPDTVALKRITATGFLTQN